VAPVFSVTKTAFRITQLPVVKAAAVAVGFQLLTVAVNLLAPAQAAA
jgi:hypothetical protein